MQETMVEKPTQNREVPLDVIKEEEQEDSEEKEDQKNHNDYENEEEQPT
jgi:hypothetical protein